MLATVVVPWGGLAACAHYEPRPLDAAATADRLLHRTLADPGLRTFAEQAARPPAGTWPPPVWGLTELTIAGFYFHPELEVARAQWAVARAGEATAGQSPNPRLSVTPAFDSTRSTPSPWILTSFVNLTFETGGKRAAREDQAHQQAEHARYQVAAVAWQVRSRIRQALLALRTAGAAQRLLEGQQAIHVENVRRSEERFTLGDISTVELMQVRLAAQASRMALHDASERAVDAHIQLAAAVGVPPEALAGIPLSYEALDGTPPDISLAGARRAALMNRADLLAALSSYAESEAALRLQIANQYPDIQLTPGYTFNQGSDQWSLGLVNLSLPLLNHNEGAIAEAEARRTEAAARFEALQFAVLESVARAEAAYRAALDKKRDADATQTESLEQVQRAEARVAAGDLSEADLVAVKLQLSAATLTQVAAVAQVQHALAALEDALQRPLDLPQVDWQDPPASKPAPGPGSHS